jgi:hypothetical protein
MAQPLLQAPPSNWEDQFPADTQPAAPNWEDQFPEDTPAPTTAATWEDQFPTDTETPATNWEDQFPEDKPFFNLADTASAIVDFGRGIVNTTPAALSTLSEGLTRPDKWSEDTLKNLEQDEAFQREMAAKTEQNRAAGTSSSVGESIREAGSSAGFSFGSMAAALPATVAGAYLTRSKLGANLAGGLAGGTAAYRMAGARFLNDSFKDWQTQEEQRLGRPVNETEKEAAYQELLPLAQNAGLWEAGPEAIGNMATLGAGKVILGLGKNKLTNLAKGSLAKLGIKAGAAAGAIGTELATETATQVGQGLPQAQAEAIAAGQDPALAQSAYPVSVEGVTQAFKDVAPQTLALSGLMMGAAGGVSLASKPFRKSEATPTAPTIEGDLPGTPTATPPTEAQVFVNGTTYAYDTTQLTADQIETLAATGSLQEYIDQGMVRNVFAPPPLPTSPDPATTPGTPDPGTLGPPPPPVVAPPGPTVQQAQETLGTLGNVGTRAAPTSTVGRAGPAPLPRDPEGNYDLLNHLNENPIRAPRLGTEGASADQFEWRESGDFDPTFRRFIMQEGRSNIDERAQEAYREGFIPEPTAAALAAEVRNVIAKRQQQRQQGPGQTRLLSEQERAQVQFEQTQERLATTGQPIDLDQLAPGDTLRIGGQPVTVADIEFDEDGYTTRALLRTPTGTVRVTPETNLRADAPTTATAPRTLGDINAELAAWADQTIAQGQGQMSMGLDPTLLAAYAVKGAQLIAEGFTTFGRWSKEMLRRFGAAVRQYLAEAWQSAKKNSQVGARANLNPNARLSARPPTFAEALEGQTRQSQFGERVQADDRLTDPLRAAPVSTFAIQGQQQALDQANAIIRQLGLEGATATFQNDATLPMPVRIAGLMQAALQYDARAALALRQGNDTGSAAADAATEAAIEAKASLEVIGNETGRNLAMFNTWARMSPDGQLRRLDRDLAKSARDTIRGDTGVTPAEVTNLVNEETANLDLDAILEEVLTEGNTPSPVNLQTGAPIARNGTIIDRLLGGLETTARAISESTTIQRAVEAIDNVLKALSGKLFADPLLLTPIGQAVLKTTRTLLLQGTKISQAIADAIAVVRTKIPIPPQDVAPLTQAVTAAMVKEVIRPILRKLAFDPNYNKREATKDMLAIGIGIMEAGRLADAVIAKRPKIAKTAQDIVRQRVMRRLSDKPRSKSRKQKLPAIIDTLTLAAGAGFINERSFLDAWDKKFPLPKLTPADRQRLRQMAAAINLLPEGILRQAEAIKFQNEVALIEGIAAVDALTAAWYANLLAGISTQGVNIWGNGLNLFFRSLAVGLASPSDVTKLFSGLAAGVRPGLREAKQVLKTGQLLKVNKMDDMQVTGTLELMATQGGPKGFGQWLAYVMSLGGLTRYVFRAMGAMDAVFWYSAQEGMAHLAASRTLRKAGGLKPGTQQFNAEFIRQLGGDETQYLADLDQARTELKAAAVAVTPSAVNRRAWEIRQQRRSLDIRDASVRWADRNVMQQQPEGIGRAITGIITLLQKVRPYGVPIFVPLVPFNRILSNLFESSLDWAGVGILRGLLGSHLTDFNNKDRRLFDTVERRERFMAGMLGMGIAGTLLAAAMALKDQDDEEVPFMVYAMGPPDASRRGTMPKGWRPYSIKINGQYVSFAESPMGPLLGAVGAWMDSTRYGKTENKTLTDRGLIAFQNALNSFMSMGVLSSMKDIVELWSGQGGARSLKQAALSPVAGFVPAQGFLRDMAPLFDNTKISDADVFGALVKDIPVLKSYGRPALNVLGEPVKIEGIPVVRRFATGQRPDANIAFIQQHQLRISALPRTIEIGDYLPKRERIAQGLEDSDRRRALSLTAIENGVMTADQQYAFTKAQGNAIKSGLERLRKSTADRPSSPQTTALLQKQLDRTIQAARITAMRQIVSELR